MPSTTLEKNNLATKFGVDAPYVTAFSSPPSGGTAGTEVTGITRVASSWGTASGGVITQTVSLTIPSGQTVQGIGLYSASTAGNYIDGGSVTSQAFPTGGTYTITINYTQT